MVYTPDTPETSVGVSDLRALGALAYARMSRRPKQATERDNCYSACRTEACAVAKVCLVLSGESRPRWKKAGKTIRLPSSERSEGTIACG